MARRSSMKMPVGTGMSMGAGYEKPVKTTKAVAVKPAKVKTKIKR